jgi:hypothetical protein
MLRLLVCRQSAKDRSSAESNEGHQRGPEAIVRHQRSMHMHLKGLLEVADDEDDDAEADHALQEDDDNERPFPAGVDAVDRTSGHVESWHRNFDLQLVKVHVRAWCAGRSRNPLC